MNEEDAWKEIRNKSRFHHAFRGLYVFWKTTRNLRIHVPFAILVVGLGFYLHVSSIEWIMLVFAMGLVFVAEALNSAIEIDIDLTSPNFHPYARDTKDVAAAAVLIASIISVVIGLIIFLPKVLIMLR